MCLIAEIHCTKERGGMDDAKVRVVGEHRVEFMRKVSRWQEMKAIVASLATLPSLPPSEPILA